jgi:hypothetical protein
VAPIHMVNSCLILPWTPHDNAHPRDALVARA